MGANAGGKGSVAKGKSKGSASRAVTAAPVHKPWLKPSAGSIGKGSGGSKGYSAKAGGKQSSGLRTPIAAWTKVQPGAGKVGGGKGKAPFSKGSAKGGFITGKGKGKGKDKGKRKGAAPKKSQFWVRKMEEENRTVLEGELLTGICDSYNWKGGWGFIQPDDPESLPEEAREKLDEAAAASKKQGKEIDSNLIYFRKPDVEANFRIMKGSAVTFQLYLDDKGCGACDVCDATGGEEEADE